MNDEYSSRDKGDKRRRRMAANVKQQQQQKNRNIQSNDCKVVWVIFFFSFSLL